MAEVISKGMFALQRHGNRPVSITVGGETFYFRKLTISAGRGNQVDYQTASGFDIEGTG